MAKRKVRAMELHDIEQPNTAVMPEQEELIKLTTETIGNFPPKTLLHVTVVFQPPQAEDFSKIFSSCYYLEFILCSKIYSL